MNDDLDIELLDSQKTEASGKRPSFLTVLCILTFVGAGFGIIGGLFGILTMGTMERTMTAANSLTQGSPIGIDFENAYRWMKIAQVLNLVGSALCLAGALFMWNVRKLGFYIYVPGQVLPIIGSFMTMNSVFGGSILGNFGIAMTVFSMIFPIAFIIMYGLNLKHMR